MAAAGIPVIVAEAVPFLHCTVVCSACITVFCVPNAFAHKAGKQ